MGRSNYIELLGGRARIRRGGIWGASAALNPKRQWFGWLRAYLAAGGKPKTKRNELQTHFTSMIRRHPPTTIEGGGALIDVQLCLDRDALNSQIRGSDLRCRQAGDIDSYRELYHSELRYIP